MGEFCMVKFGPTYAMAYARLMGIMRHPLNDEPDYSDGWFYTDDSAFREGVNNFICPIIDINKG